MSDPNRKKKTVDVGTEQEHVLLDVLLSAALLDEPLADHQDFLVERRHVVACFFLLNTRTSSLKLRSDTLAITDAL